MGRFVDKSAPLQSLNPIAIIEPVTFGNIFGWAHRVMSGHWGLLAGSAAFLVIYGFIASMITGMLDQSIMGTFVYFRPLEFLHALLISGPLSVGPMYMAARIFRGQQATFNDIWIGFSRWAPIVFIGFLVQLGYLIAMIPMGVVVAMSQRATAGNAGLTILLLFVLGIGLIIASLYFAVRLYFATLLCADPLGPKLKAIESITESWRITRHCAWTLFLTSIVISIIVGISAVCLFIPLVLYGLPLTYGAAGAVYVVLTHQSGIIPVQGYDVCPFCDYDLSDLSTNRCPECGAHVIRPTDNPEYGGLEKPMPHEAVTKDPPDIPLSDPDDDPPAMPL